MAPGEDVGTIAIPGGGVALVPENRRQSANPFLLKRRLPGEVLGWSPHTPR
jgi:hypothetical protein